MNDQTKPTTIGALLRVARERRALTQRDAAAALYVSKVTYSRWECGKSIPDMRYRTRLAGFAGVSLADVGDACIAGVAARREVADG